MSLLSELKRGGEPYKLKGRDKKKDEEFNLEKEARRDAESQALLKKYYKK